MSRVFSSLLLALCCFLGSCGGDSHEDIAADTVDLMNEMTDILGSATDKASAEEALPGLDGIIEKMQDIEKRGEALGKPDDEEMQRLAEEAGRDDALAGLTKEVMRIAMDQEISSVLQPALQKMQSMGK